MTKLRAYLADARTTQAQLAGIVGVSKGYMSQLVSGPKTPSLEIAVKIEAATDGKVRPRDWVESTPEVAK